MTPLPVLPVFADDAVVEAMANELAFTDNQVPRASRPLNRAVEPPTRLPRFW